MQELCREAVQYAKKTNRLRDEELKSLPQGTTMKTYFAVNERLDDYRLSPALLRELEKLADFKV